MKIAEMNAMDRGRKVRIFVSPMMKNQYCDDECYDGGFWCKVLIVDDEFAEKVIEYEG